MSYFIGKLFVRRRGQSDPRVKYLRDRIVDVEMLYEITRAEASERLPALHPFEQGLAVVFHIQNCNATLCSPGYRDARGSCAARTWNVYSTRHAYCSKGAWPRLSMESRIGSSRYAIQFGSSPLNRVAHLQQVHRFAKRKSLTWLPHSPGRRGQVPCCRLYYRACHSRPSRQRDQRIHRRRSDDVRAATAFGKAQGMGVSKLHDASIKLNVHPIPSSYFFQQVQG